MLVMQNLIKNIWRSDVIWFWHQQMTFILYIYYSNPFFKIFFSFIWHIYSIKLSSINPLNSMGLFWQRNILMARNRIIFPTLNVELCDRRNMTAHAVSAALKTVSHIKCRRSNSGIKESKTWKFFYI